MSPLKYSIAAALLSAALTAGALYRSRSKQEYEAEGLRSRNAGMQFKAYQRLHAQQAPVVTPNQEKPVEAKPEKPNTRSPLNYRNDGQATPRAALQTFVWACDQGDNEKVVQLLYFDAENRRQAEAFFVKLPEPVRAKWKSVDEMAAALLIVRSMARSFPAADILDAVPIEPDGETRVTCKAPFRIQFQKTDSGWNYVVTAAVLEQLEKEITAGFGG